jgi:hypothetical protein
MGKWDEAEWEVIRQLELQEDDFEGWMMLAELYALHHHDLHAADATLRELCAQPDLSISDFAVALHRLADWHLKLGEDPHAARQVLECICARLPGTHLDRMARQRIALLPHSREALLKAKAGRTFALPDRESTENASDSPVKASLSREAARELAVELVEALKTDPDDAPSRERFARLLAEHLNQPQAALDQLNLLLGMPGMAADLKAGWLLLGAKWHLRYTRRIEEAQQQLEQLLDQHADSPHAFEAQRRLNLLRMEARIRLRTAENQRLKAGQPRDEG